MIECFKCGISGEVKRLSEVISNEGIIRVCDVCFSEENFPIVKKPTILQLEKIEKKQTVYERLVSSRGIDFSKSKEKENLANKKSLLKKQNTTLRDIVEKNLKINFVKKPSFELGLIDNFHWVLMRVRRLRHLSQKQVAQEIKEPESNIKMAEKGVLPGNYKDLINKLEIYFGIKLFNKASEEKKEIKKIDFSPTISKELTISDLKSLKAKRELENSQKEDIQNSSFEDEEIDIGEIGDTEDITKGYGFNDDIDISSKQDLETKPEFVEKIKYISNLKDTKKNNELSDEELSDLIFRKREN